MADNHVVTFYSIEKIGDHKKVGRTVERHCIKNSIVGTFFSTPQGVNTTLSGKKKALIEERKELNERLLKIEQDLKSL